MVEHIVVRGARENNLKDVDVDLPKRQLTVFTGVSGSGKSSLVFGTIAAESQRLINETYSAFVQGFMPSLPRPDVDVLQNLTTAILVDQERMGANPRSTVGTVTDANAMLRVMFSRLGDPHIGPANAFSFNVPSSQTSGMRTTSNGQTHVLQDETYLGGMCPRCEGRGTVSDINLAELFDDSKSLADGALTIPGYTVDGWMVRIFTESGFVPPDKPIRDFTAQERDDFLTKESTKVKVAGINMTYEGLLPKIQKSMLSKDVDAMQPHIRAFVERAVVFTACPECEGTRLSAAARSSKIKGLNIADACAMQISDLVAWVHDLDASGIGPLKENLLHLLESFVDIGLGYLSLDRPSGTLSGGEAQRTRMIRHLGSPLTDVTYIFDEPTTGLHAHDVEKMNDLLRQLCAKGNTVLVVEHKPQVMAIADHIVDMGPGAGQHGGTIVYEGDHAGLAASGTRTGDHLGHRQPVKSEPRTPSGSIPIRDARVHNLQGIDVDVPTGVLVAVTGVAGSGKSSLIHGCLPRDGFAFVDQSAIRGSRRSNPATYTGILEPIRKAFAKENGVKPALFSANSEGACATCNGLGMVYVDLGFMATVGNTCEDCEGRRFQAAVLEYQLRGLSIADVLDLSVEQALDYFEERPVVAVLQRLADVGLTYLSLGQALNTLSGGERQRLKLAIEMGTQAPTIVLDEPTAGLHMADVDRLVGLLDQIVDSGRTVIVIEHNLDVVARADWVIDIGPGAGHDGGKVVFTGPPAELATQTDSLTGRHLAARV